jgi:putative acetyltransferase
MKIITLAPTSPDAQSLIAKSDAYMAALYPPESNHLESPQALQLSNAVFLGIYLEDGLAACGAVKILDDDDVYGEMKRIFVVEEHRRKGLSKHIMRYLEAHLVGQGVNIARLETGVKQPEALALYKALGYEEREPFGSYDPDPLSVFMEKRL